MDERKKEIINKIEKCPSAIEVFGLDFIVDAIQTYDVINGDEWSRKNYFIANYIMSASFYLNHNNFITELEKMLSYFLINHKNYIKSKSILSRLMSKDEPLFQGKWSELIFAYFLKRRGVDIIDISKTEQTMNGDIELYDIKTNFGEIEITAIMSAKGKVFDTENIFLGILEIGDIEKQLVNKKIKNKSGKNILVIDCTFVDELHQKLYEVSQGIPIAFNVFKSTSKNVFLFLRHNETQQVDFCKYLNDDQS